MKYDRETYFKHSTKVRKIFDSCVFLKNSVELSLKTHFQSEQAKGQSWKVTDGSLRYSCPRLLCFFEDPGHSEDHRIEQIEKTKAALLGAYSHSIYQGCFHPQYTIIFDYLTRTNTCTGYFHSNCPILRLL